MLGYRRCDLDAIEGDIIAIEADIVLILAFFVDIDARITNIENAIIEIHDTLHSWERWFQPTKQPDPETHVASPIGAGIGDFQMDAGNNDWGTWIQLLGSTDTPVTVGGEYYEMHRLTVQSTEHDEPYFIQVGFGASGAQSLIDGTYTEVVFTPATNQVDSGPVELHVKRVAAGVKAWARCMCPGQNTALIDFYFGLHEYNG